MTEEERQRIHEGIWGKPVVEMSAEVHHPAREPQKTPPAKPEEPKEPDELPKPEDPGSVPVKEPEEAYAESTSGIQMNASQFQLMLSTIIAEARKPVKNEREVARIERMRQHNRSMQRDNRQMQINRFYNCNHMQLPGSVLSGCSVVAWATQSDQVKRGTCQHCGTIFSPKREECASQEIWESYKMLVRLPTHPAGNINSIFQSA